MQNSILIANLPRTYHRLITHLSPTKFGAKNREIRGLGEKKQGVSMKIKL